MTRLETSTISAPSVLEVVSTDNGYRLVLKMQRSSWYATRTLSAVPGIRSTTNGVIAPLDPRLAELIMDTVEDVALTPGAQRWYEDVLRHEQTNVALKQLPDAPVDLPWAELLWPFQRTGVNFLLKQRRTLLADEPGLGKTVQAIATVEASKAYKRVLIACPKSLMEWWYEEIHRWVERDDLKVHLCHSPIRDLILYRFNHKGGGYLIINWEQLRIEPDILKGVYDWFIGDEAQKVKNRKTKLFKATKRIRAPRWMLLTGTPFSNNPAEVWTLLHLLRPDKYTSYWRFFTMYVNTAMTFTGFRKITGVRNPILLRRELAPVMIRRLKKDHLSELPSKRYQVIPVQLQNEQERMYATMAREMIAQLEDETVEAVNIISMITRLRQLTSGTATLFDRDVSAKLDVVEELVEQYDKLVVFTQFRKTVTALSARLKRKGIKHVCVMGGISVHPAVNKFQSDPEVKVFIGTAQTGGVGVTLTAASTVVFVDVHWNPAKQTQAEDRVHRIGQRDGVLIVTLHCHKTVDDLVRRVLDQKIGMQEEVLREELLSDLYAYLEV